MLIIGAGLVHSRAAANMCDHKWILLTSRKLEQHLGWSGDSAWSVRGCERCLEVEINKHMEEGWKHINTQVDVPSPNAAAWVPVHNSYWRGIGMFGGGRLV